MGAPRGNKNAAGPHKKGWYKGSKMQKRLRRGMNPYTRKRINWERATRPMWARGARWSPRND